MHTHTHTHTITHTHIHAHTYTHTNTHTRRHQHTDQWCILLRKRCTPKTCLTVRRPSRTSRACPSPSEASIPTTTTSTPRNPHPDRRAVEIARDLRVSRSSSLNKTNIPKY